MAETRWHRLSSREVAALLNTDEQYGLTSSEADRRLKENGPNELAESGNVSPIALFLRQFQDFMVLVLLAATAVSAFLGETLDAVTIVAIVVLNGVLGFFQEFRAERSLRTLKRLSAPTAKVVRDGRRTVVPAGTLVPGDVVVVESGDRIPADVRWLEANGLLTDESALTGESEPVAKTADPIGDDEPALGDLRNLGFMGTMAVRGTGRAVVVRTGMATEIGKIAELIRKAEAQKTPLERRLEQLGKVLIGVSLVLTALVAAAGILHGQPAYEMFLTGVSLAVAAIPEGLPAVVTIALALGVQRMIRRRAVVRKLQSVETLGCASFVCSDKTGTLTRNQMTVAQIWIGGRRLDVSGSGYEPFGEIRENGKPVDARRDAALRRLLQVFALCNNAELVQTQGRWTVRGDSTEGALLALAAKAGLSKPSLEALYHREIELPFTSERKRMSVAIAHQGGRLLLTKGAPDVLLDLCTYALWEDKVIPLTPTIKAKIAAAAEQMAGEALRVIAAAYRELRDEDGVADETAETRLVFVGMAGMIDPPRPGVREAIARCRLAGIRTVMITGDHRATAVAIAGQLGMLSSGALVVTGRELDAMTDDQLDELVERIAVYARVTPEHKLRIVRSLKRRGHVVAMTGDGVNDAPALKAADIGVAMGGGTDVAKEASSLVLADDHFATIAAAVEEGRNIYENIRKFIRYLLASNVGEIMTMLLAMMAGLPVPLLPIQILWVNLVTDGLPAMALGVDQPESDLMLRDPRPAKEGVFARRLGWKIVSRGLLIGICTLLAFWLVLRHDPSDPERLVRAQTVAFATLVMAQLIHVFDCRSSRSIFHRPLLENRALVWAVLSSLALMLAVLYWDPLQTVFHTVDLGAAEWCLVLAAAGFPTFFMGIGSVLSPRFRRKRPRPAIRTSMHRGGIAL